MRHRERKSSMSGRGDYHGVRAGEKRKAEADEATMGVAPKLPKTATEKDRLVATCAREPTDIEGRVPCAVTQHV